MAAVFIPPSRETSLNMSTRRPLANVPNATNSPHRVSLVPAKRSRTAAAQVDIPYGQPPPKKQVVEGADADTQTTIQSKTSNVQGTDSKLFSRRTNNGHPSAFEKKLVAARDKERQSQSKGTKQEKPSTENISIKQWQRHYRKAFPHFVFYFDCISIDVRSKCSRQVMALGAREEKFFSRLVTHVVTSRPIPPETDRRAPPDFTHNTSQESAGDGVMLQTINPAELEMHLHLAVCSKREQSQDVLHRAREMGMKIWAVEKLQRMITTINDADIANPNGHLSRSNLGSQTKSRGKDDLSQALQNELNGPSDRSHLSVLKDLVLFKGPFIYVHDMDEKTRPVMVREYPKVAKRQDGIWPQFRSAPLGKCPFIEEAPTKRDAEKPPSRQEKEKKTFIKPTIPQVGKAVEMNKGVEHVPLKKEPSPIEEDESPPQAAKPEESQDIPQEIPLSPKKSSESFVPPQLHQKGPFYHGREPAASGVQPSNITSAIRSQMVSSTAAAPGAKAGLSKEVHELKRKVLEKSNGGFSAAVSHVYRPLTTANMMADKEHADRMSKPTRPEKLGHIEEETTQSESNDTTKRRANARRSGDQRKKERRRDPKPGYCENCRDKFDDFDEHVMSRKHRKFAANGANWAELDLLLKQLTRTPKEEYDLDA
ncbi:protein serine/threonine kinase activating protein nimO [Aspergillus lucknowensis]|uniref:Dfp1/Him1, central region-domain-containing protein n=1 Tax=Aspergillus lucknowensis TaxID=176173 RepID=A0ABR4M0N7_9EURO